MFEDKTFEELYEELKYQQPDLKCLKLEDGEIVLVFRRQNDMVVSEFKFGSPTRVLLEEMNARLEVASLLRENQQVKKEDGNVRRRIRGTVRKTQRRVPELRESGVEEEREE